MSIAVVQIKGSVRDSLWTLKFDMKHLKKAVEYRQKRFDYSNKELINRPNILRYNKTCWRSMEELIRDVFLLIPLIGFASTSLSATAVWTQGVVWKRPAVADGWLGFLQKGTTPAPTSFLHITLNNLMVRFQSCWSFGECGVALHYHRFHAHSSPERKHLIRILSIVQIEQNCVLMLNLILWNRTFNDILLLK